MSTKTELSDRKFPEKHDDVTKGWKAQTVESSLAITSDKEAFKSGNDEVVPQKVVELKS